jgi:hypothetical protein
MVDVLNWFIMADMQPDNQPVKKVGDIFSSRARHSMRAVFGI